jgi:large subunit ribosomal protein L13
LHWKRLRFDTQNWDSLDWSIRVLEAERRRLSMRTEVPSQAEIVRAWHVIDANAAVLGRVASRAAVLLMGKHKPMYAPSVDTGDHVVIINAARVKLTGGKEGQKLYRRHSGYPGGLVETGARRMRETRPERMVELAISGMLPKTKLGKQMYRKLKVYAGEHHPHQAQKPVPFALKK